jgi:hypothetical protein
MSIIISKEGKNAQKLDRTVIDREDYLQNYIHHNPESLPLHEIREDLRLLILAREFPTNSGPIDALGLDQEGNVYVIETKLYKNPDKRLVLAQVLDYGASLWRTYEDGDEFIGRVEAAVVKTFSAGLLEKIQDFYGVDAESAAAVIQNVRQNLGDGNFRFVVLMDRLEDRLRDLITFVNQNSRFDIFGVELDFYRFNEYEILIPKLYGAEVKKEAGVAKRAPGIRRTWNEASFFEEVEKTLSPEVATAVKDLYQFSRSIADRVTFGSGQQTGSFNPKFDHICNLSLYSVYSTGRLGLNFKWVSQSGGVPEVAERFGQELKRISGFDLPDDFRERDPELPPEKWVPRLNEFKGVVRSITQREVK